MDRDMYYRPAVIADVPVDPPVFRSGYNYDRDAASVASGLFCKDPSLAVQSQAEEADINTLVKRFGITDRDPIPSSIPVPWVDSEFGEFDYQSAQNEIALANQAFSALPANVRSEFGNDPGRFVSFCSNPENEKRMLALGLAVKREEPKEAAPTKVEIVNAPTIEPSAKE